MSHLVFEVLQAKIEKNSTFFFLTDFVYQYTCINTFFFFFFFVFFFYYISKIFFFFFFFFIKIYEKIVFFFFFTDFVYQYTCINTFFFFFFFLLFKWVKPKEKKILLDILLTAPVYERREGSVC